MAAATAGYEWTRSSPLMQHSETPSPVYPDRPIRPLPKRRLRERLSPEQAEHITFPPAPPSVAPIFGYPYSGQYDQPADPHPRQQRAEHHGHTCDCGGEGDLESASEEEGEDPAYQASPSLMQQARNLLGAKSTSAGGTKFAKQLPPGSTTSSVDGYESFENTNNKKKRKIPNSGSGSGHHSSLSADMNNLGLSANGEGLDDGTNGVGQYYGSGSSAAAAASPGTGVSGAGRGRYGRASARISERRPLGASTNGLNAFANGKRPGRQEYNNGGAVQSGKDSPPNQGIISEAIANASAHAPLSAQPGDENVSLLQQQAAAKSSPQKTQFTFTCGSNSANQPVWPGQNGAMAGNANQAGAYPPAHAMPPVNPNAPLSRQSRGTQASHPGVNGAAPPAPGQHPHLPANPNDPNAPPPQRPRRRRTAQQEYDLAERRRKVNQRYENSRKATAPGGLKREDVWICEFCEYESIFGVKPYALIRDYEAKDRKARQEAEKRKRLLEKAKMKNKKGKGKGKGKANNANNALNQSHAPNNQREYADQDDPNFLDGQDDYFDDGYEDDLAAVPPPPTPNEIDEPLPHVPDTRNPGSNYYPSMSRLPLTASTTATPGNSPEGRASV